MKVIIVDDFDLIREGLKKVISKEKDIEIVGEANSAEELFELLQTIKVDIIILDIALPGRSGLDIIKDVLFQQPEVKILILSMHPEERMAVSALRAGASGYVPKSMASKTIVEALRKIEGGRRYISSTLAEYLAQELNADYEKPIHETLSTREFEVMKLIAEGKPVRDIAELLFISVNTVTSYRSRIMEKMRMKTNAELIRYALEKELI